MRSRSLDWRSMFLSLTAGCWDISDDFVFSILLVAIPIYLEDMSFRTVFTILLECSSAFSLITRMVPTTKNSLQWGDTWILIVGRDSWYSFFLYMILSYLILLERRSTRCPLVTCRAKCFVEILVIMQSFRLPSNLPRVMYLWLFNDQHFISQQYCELTVSRTLLTLNWEKMCRERCVHTQRRERYYTEVKFSVQEMWVPLSSNRNNSSKVGR